MCPTVPTILPPTHSLQLSSWHATKHTQEKRSAASFAPQSRAMKTVCKRALPTLAKEAQDTPQCQGRSVTLLINAITVVIHKCLDTTRQGTAQTIHIV